MLSVALEAAAEMADARPSHELLDYLSSVSLAARWDDRASTSLRKVVELGNPRSWRFLETTGILDRALPEVAETLRRRHADPFMLDAMQTHQWRLLERLRSLPDGDQLRGQFERLEHPEWLRLATLLVEGLEGRSQPGKDAADIVRRVGFDAAGEAEIVGLVEDDGLLRSASALVDAFDEEEVLQLASHLDSPERARATYILAMLRDESLDAGEGERISVLHDLIQRALTDPDLTGLDARHLIERRRTEAMLMSRDRPDVVNRIRQAPSAYIARQQPNAIARHAILTLPPLSSSTARVEVIDADAGRFWVDIAAKNRPGLMAGVTGALADAELDVDRAVVATWDDDTAIESFLVTSSSAPATGDLVEMIASRLGQRIETGPVPGAIVAFDDLSSPWHTTCEVTAPDFKGLLHSIASVFAAAGVEIKAESIGRSDGIAVDRFEVTGDHGARLTGSERNLIRAHLIDGVVAKRRKFRSGFAVSSSLAGSATR